MPERSWSKVRVRTGALAVGGLLLIGGASACSSSSPTVDTAKSGTPGSAATNVPRTDVGSVPGTDVSSEGTLPSADAGTTVPGETTTTVAGAPPVTGANGAPVTTNPTATTTPGSPTTVAGVTTTAKPGGVTTQAPVTTKPVTTVATTTPTTAAAKPGLKAGGPPSAAKPDGDPDIHCMGTAPSASTSLYWTASSATEVAVAFGKLSNAYDAATSKKYAPDASPKTVGPFPCSGDATQYSTITARGPGGDTTVVVTWTMHHM